MQISKIDWFDLITSYGKQALFSLTLILLLLFLGFRIFGNQKKQPSSNILAESEQYERLFTLPEPGEEKALTKAAEVVAKNPHLEAKLGGKMAQRLLDENQGAKALLLGEKGIKRIEELSPLYARFARNSLAIAKGEYSSALQEAKVFKEELKTQKEEKESLLYHFNLLRIAFLEMHLGNLENERSSWNELMKAGEENPYAWTTLQNCFQKESLSLTDLIQSRLEKKN
jgi:hypothetical protein